MTHTPRIPRLFEPARLGPLELPNRLVMAPMTRNRAAADGVPLRRQTDDQPAGTPQQ